MFRIIALILLALCSLSSCSPGESRNDAISVAVSQEPPTFDVHVNSSQVARYVIAGTVAERVVTLDSQGRPVPELAQSFHSEDEGCTWVFTLRDDVLFHNGRVMDSTDAVMSLNRWIDHDSAASAMLGGARFTAVDGHTIRIEAGHPILFLPDMMASSPQSAVIFARECLEDLGEDGLIKDYIGTGPYRFVSWTRGQDVLLERFDDYCAYGGPMDGLAGRKHAYMPRIQFHFVPDSFARTSGCETGRYHYMNDVMNDDIPRLMEDEDLFVSRGDEAGSIVLLFNKKSGPASDIRIRQAVNTALDLDVVMAACYGSGGYVMHPDYMEGHQTLWHVSDSDPRYDVGDKEAARQMLDDMAYDGTPIKVLSSNLSNLDKCALAIQSELEAAGFEVELTIVDWATMMAWRNDPSRWDICLTAMTSVSIPSQKLFLSPDYPGWSDDARLQEMMAGFSASTTIGEAQASWRDIQDYCLDYLPAIVAGHYLSGYLGRDELVGVIEYRGFYFFNAQLTS